MQNTVQYQQLTTVLQKIRAIFRKTVINLKKTPLLYSHCHSHCLTYMHYVLTI